MYTNANPIRRGCGAEPVRTLLAVTGSSPRSGLRVVGRALATSGAKRAALLPDTPTYTELGYKDLVVEDGLGVYLPAKTPADHVERLNSALLEANKARDVQDAVRGWGFEISSEGPREFAARLQRERVRWGSIVKATGFAAID